MTISAAVKFSKDQLKGLANNLTMLIKKKNLSEGEIATALNIPVMTIRRLTSGETTDPHISTLKQIADYFEVSIDSLIGGIDSTPIELMHKKNMPCFVPVLDWAKMSQITSLKDIDLSTWKEWQPVILGEQHTLSEDAFALESKPSMRPRFPTGTLFIIDPNETPMDGDLVLIKIKNDDNLSIREISIDPPKWQLLPTIPGSETLFYSPKEHAIIGPVLLTMLYSRK